MRLQSLAWLLLAGLAYGQAATPPAAAPPDIAAKAQVPETQVGPNDAVITLTNFCADSTQHGDACKTVITRAEFEKLVDAVQPGASPPVRRQIASTYAQMLKMAADAKKRGIEKDPKFEEIMRFARIQILSQQLRLALQEEANKVPDADIEDYYKKNEAAYEQATLERIFIPRAKQIPPPPMNTGADAKTTAPAPPTPPTPPTEEQQKEAQAAMAKVADDIHARAVKGEDFDVLQKEAYAATGLPGNAPATKYEKMRRSTLPKDHVLVMDLKVGEVSDLITEPNGAHFIYKMISKETLPLDAMKTDIRGVLSGQRFHDSMQAFQSDTDLNDAYFGPAQSRPMPPAVHGPKLPAPPPPSLNTPH